MTASPTIFLLLLLLLSFTCTSTHALATTTRTSKNVAMLSQALRLIYRQGGTLGVLQRCEGISDYSGDTLVRATLEASRGDKGMASGILNAFLGSFCNASGHKAVELMRAYDGTETIKPDLVALCLAHVATASDDNAEEANEFLSRAEGYFGSSNSKIIHDNKQQSPDWDIIEKQHGVQLLQESPEFVVVSKPSGMVCYHGQTTASTTSKAKRKKQKQKTQDTSLEDCLLQNGVSLSTLNKQGRGLVHRLDRGTSGCLVLAKTNRMHADLMARFFLRDIFKSYQALVCHNGLSDKGEINLDIERRPARSSFKLETQVGSWLSRIKVKTDQGRRHQVRLHCSKGLGAPILLDPLYGGQAILSRFKGDAVVMPKLQQWRSEQKFGLHADSLVVPKHDIDVVADLPSWWQELEADLA